MTRRQDLGGLESTNQRVSLYFFLILLGGSVGEFTLICLCIGASKTINFPFDPNGKLMVLGTPVLKHIRGLVDIDA